MKLKTYTSVEFKNTSIYLNKANNQTIQPGQMIAPGGCSCTIGCSCSCSCGTTKKA